MIIQARATNMPHVPPRTFPFSRWDAVMASQSLDEPIPVPLAPQSVQVWVQGDHVTGRVPHREV